MRRHQAMQLFLFLFLVCSLAISRYIPSVRCALLLSLPYKRQAVSDMHLIQYDHPEVLFFARGRFCTQFPPKKVRSSASRTGCLD